MSGSVRTRLTVGIAAITASAVVLAPTTAQTPRPDAQQLSAPRVALAAAVKPLVVTPLTPKQLDTARTVIGRLDPEAASLLPQACACAAERRIQLDRLGVRVAPGLGELRRRTGPVRAAVHSVRIPDRRPDRHRLRHPGAADLRQRRLRPHHPRGQRSAEPRVICQRCRGRRIHDGQRPSSTSESPSSTTSSDGSSRPSRRFPFAATEPTTLTALKLAAEPTAESVEPADDPTVPAKHERRSPTSSTPTHPPRSRSRNRPRQPTRRTQAKPVESPVSGTLPTAHRDADARPSPCRGDSPGGRRGRAQAPNPSLLGRKPEPEKANRAPPPPPPPRHPSSSSSNGVAAQGVVRGGTDGSPGADPRRESQTPRSTSTR